MAPQPKTHGTRRSHAKPVGESVNGTTADESEPKLRRSDVKSARMAISNEKDHRAKRKGERQDTPSQVLGKEDGSASIIPVGELARSCTPNIEEGPTTVLPALGPFEKRRTLAQNLLPLDVPKKELDSRRNSAKGLVNGSATSESQKLVINADFESISKDYTFHSDAGVIFSQNGMIEDNQQSSVGHGIDLKDSPSNLRDLSIWVAHLIRKVSDKNPLSSISERKQQASRPQHGLDIDTSEALNNIEGVRMTRGNAKKRLQQSKAQEPANATVESGDKFFAGTGKLFRPRDAARLERRLKGDLDEKLKQKLFGLSVSTDMSSNIIEQNACGKLLFNALTDMSDSTNRNSASVLKSALKESKTHAAFLSALKILASSSEIMSFVNFLFSKEDAPQCEASMADESRPSTEVDTFGATTVTETSGLTSHAGTSISDAEGSRKATARYQATDKMTPERQKRSQKVVQALEAATNILIQIQQGEAGINHTTSNASGSMIPHPIFQGHMASSGTLCGPPFPDHPTYGMAYGPPVGVISNNYASPYANDVFTYQHSYASPYPNSLNQPPVNYASPYSNSGVPNQASGSGFGARSGNQANKHDGHVIHHDAKGNNTPHQDIIGVTIEAKSGNSEPAGQDSSNKVEDASKSSIGAIGHDISNEKEETGKACDKVYDQGFSREKNETSNVIDVDETDVDDANKPDSSRQGDEASSDDDLTDNDLTTARTHNQIIAPPAEDHKLFTGERLGDFTCRENIDWLLTMGNGGKTPKPSKKTRMISPLRISTSQPDAKIQTEVSRIINEIWLYKDWLTYPCGTAKQVFYASAEGQRLAAELRRQMVIMKPVLNTIISRAESQARLKFYQLLESRAVNEKRDREMVNRYHGPPVQMQQWFPPPAGFPAARFPIPPPLPSNGPTEIPFVPRGNVMVAPPGGRNMEEERKAETYGYPPMPGSRPGASQQGQKRKRAARY